MFDVLDNLDCHPVGGTVLADCVVQDTVPPARRDQAGHAGLVLREGEVERVHILDCRHPAQLRTVSAQEARSQVEEHKCLGFGN